MPKTAPAADPLAPLAPETLRQIAATGVIRAYPKNTVVINEGEVADSLFIVLSGRMKVYASNAAGREVVIAFHGPGEYVGEMSLDGSPRSASVMTVEPTTCAVVGRASFLEFLLAHPDFALHLIEKPDAKSRSLLKFVPGPDFPTGGVIVDPRSEIAEAYVAKLPKAEEYPPWMGG